MKPHSDVPAAVAQLEKYLGLSSERERELLGLLAYDLSDQAEADIALDCRVLDHATACGELISDATGGALLEKYELPSNVQSIRVTAAIPGCPWLVLFTLDWLETGQVVIGWCHDCDKQAAAETVVALAGLFAPRGQEERCEIDFYSERQTHQAAPLREAKALIADGLARNNVPYVELAIGPHAAYCDVDPSEGRERQMGIIVSQEQLLAMSGALRSRLGEYLAQSNMRPTLRASCDQAISTILDRVPKLFKERKEQHDFSTRNPSS
jgi:hypothetical protein